MKYSDILSELKRKMAFCFDDSVCLSYPVAGMIGGRRVDKVFLYRKAVGTAGLRPFASLVTDAENGDILLLESCKLHDFMDTQQYPLTRKLDYSLPNKTSVQDFKMEQQMIRKLYEGVRTFAFSNELTAEQKELLEKYTFLFTYTTPRELQPFYEALSPEFTVWAREV